MNIFIQGMRRSGTTILFDLLHTDGRFHNVYEPLGIASNNKGGGSGLKNEDYPAAARMMRDRFCENNEGLDWDFFNYGAPRDSSLEFKSEVPSLIESYLSSFLSHSKDNLIKFTRAYCKIGLLHKIDPKAFIIHVHRDPKAVVSAYMLGKNRVNQNKYCSADDFFNCRSENNAWSSRALFRNLILLPKYTRFKDSADFMKILLLWHYTFTCTRNDGIRLYKDRYYLHRHEDYYNSPLESISRLYSFLGLEMPDHLEEWMKNNVRPASPPLFADDKRWGEAFEILKALDDDGFDDGFIDGILKESLR